MSTRGGPVFAFTLSGGRGRLAPLSPVNYVTGVQHWRAACCVGLSFVVIVWDTNNVLIYCEACEKWWSIFSAPFQKFFELMI